MKVPAVRALRALLLEDSEDDALLVARRLREELGEVSWRRVETLDAFRGALEEGPWDLVLSDHSMPGLPPAEALALLAARGLATPFLIVSGHLTEAEACEAMRQGARGIVPKSDLGRLAPAVRGVLVGPAEAAPGRRANGRALLPPRSEAMRAALDVARRAAPLACHILVTGESGTGKELVAHLIHAESPFSAGPFVPVHCGAIPETLLESELFGHARGSFTGAMRDRPGLFEAAAGGTLFLDEIGEVPASVQMKLLRALQEREVRRVGENNSRTVNTRIVAATNRDLAGEVEAGRFRRDLFYRLRVIEVHVPALRDRPEDILPLALDRIAETAWRLRGRGLELSPAAAERLHDYPWPGNVRELENAIERAVALTRGPRIEAEDLPEEMRRASAGLAASAAPPAPGDGRPGAARTLAEVERECILEALRRTNGNRRRAAGQLGIGTATLYRKLKLYANSGDSRG